MMQAMVAPRPTRTSMDRAPSIPAPGRRALSATTGHPLRPSQVPVYSPSARARPTIPRTSERCTPSATAALHSAGLVPGLEPQPDDGGNQYVGGEGDLPGVAPQATGGGGPTAVGAGTTGAAGSTSDATVSYTTANGPTWSPHGSFMWDVLYTTTASNGWMVQEITNTFNATDVAGTNAPPGTNIIPGSMNFHYFEAWAVDGSGKLSPSAGAANDMWRKAALWPGTQGNWTMVGYDYFTRTDPASQGLTPNGASNAGVLLSGWTMPSGLGFPLFERHANGAWDSTGTTPTHTGTVGGSTP